MNSTVYKYDFLIGPSSYFITHAETTTVSLYPNLDNMMPPIGITEARTAEFNANMADAS